MKKKKKITVKMLKKTTTKKRRIRILNGSCGENPASAGDEEAVAQAEDIEEVVYRSSAA